MRSGKMLKLNKFWFESIPGTSVHPKSSECGSISLPLRIALNVTFIDNFWEGLSKPRRYSAGSAMSILSRSSRKWSSLILRRAKA
jgi:hypothetical protein